MKFLILTNDVFYCSIQGIFHMNFSNQFEFVFRNEYRLHLNNYLLEIELDFFCNGIQNAKKLCQVTPKN
jgi:hypothetical protein